jgi:hypothetical protein
MRLMFVLFLLFMTIGCDQFVEKPKYDLVVQQLSDTKTKLEVAEAKLKTCEQQPKHHYELRNEGFRTFRFDSNSGETCIKLTSQADWKSPDTVRQGCEYQDYLTSGGSYVQAECLFLDKHCDLATATK